MTHPTETLVLRTFTIACLVVALVLGTIGGLRAANVHVQITTGCEQVQGQQLCGSDLAKYRDLERGMKALAPPG